MAETLTILSVLSFLLAGVLGTASVVLWLQFDIPEVMGDLRGNFEGKSACRVRENAAVTVQDVTEELNNIMIVHTDDVIWEWEENEV